MRTRDGRVSEHRQLACFCLSGPVFVSLLFGFPKSGLPLAPQRAEMGRGKALERERERERESTMPHEESSEGMQHHSHG